MNSKSFVKGTSGKSTSVKPATPINEQAQKKKALERWENEGGKPLRKDTTAQTAPPPSHQR